GGAHRGLRPGVTLSAPHLAVDGTRDAEVCRHHQHALAGMGQESDGASHVRHDDHQVRGGDRYEARPAPPPGPSALGGATTISDGPRRAGHLFHAPLRLTEDRAGGTAPLTAAPTYSPR